MAAAELGSLWLAVKVVSGSRVLFGSKIVNCLEYELFGQLLSRLEDESFAERQVQGRIGLAGYFPPITPKVCFNTSFGVLFLTHSD